MQHYLQILIDSYVRGSAKAGDKLLVDISAEELAALKNIKAVKELTLGDAASESDRLIKALKVENADLQIQLDLAQKRHEGGKKG